MMDNSALQSFGRLVAFAAALVALNGCQPETRIQTELTPGADLNRYNTFAFEDVKADLAPTDPRAGGQGVSDHIHQVVSAQLIDHGLRHAAAGAQPDLLVSIVGSTRQASWDVAQGTAPTDPTSPRGDTAVTPSPAGSPAEAGATTQRSRGDFRGDLVIDLIDARTNALVWRAIAAGKTQPTSNGHARVDDVIRDAFAKFPQQGGG